MNVLIVTRSGDQHCTPLVVEALRAIGARPWRLDTDRFPTEHRLSLHLGNTVDSMVLDTEDGRLDLHDLEACYYRRFAPGDGLPSDMPTQYRHAAVKETTATLLGMMATLPCFHLDGYDKVRRAEVKQRQLQVARRVGLDLPDTLTTNDPEAVRAFAADHPRGIVAKMLGSFAIYEEGQEKVVFTSELKAEDLAALDTLRFSPMTFQETVPKALELRVTVVGDRIFSAAIDSQSSAQASVDWLRDGLGLIDRWVPHTIPADLERRILELMDAFDLNYGAMDFILTPEGRYIFLENNPAGEFMWLQKAPGFPIAEALAEVLTGKAWGRKRRPQVLASV